MSKIIYLIRAATAMPWAAVILLLIGVGFPVAALVMQHVFAIEPCVLCLWERLPYVVAGVLALLTLVLCRRRPLLAALLLGLCAVTFAVGGALAIFHTGVEQLWWAGTESCTIRPLATNTDTMSLREQLLNTQASASCDEVNWTFLGLSLANWNVPISFGLMLFALLAAGSAASAARRLRKRG